MLRHLMLVGSLLVVGLTQNAFAGPGAAVSDAQVMQLPAKATKKMVDGVRNCISQLSPAEQALAKEELQKVVDYVQANKGKPPAKLSRARCLERARFLAKLGFTVTSAEILICVLAHVITLSAIAAVAATRGIFVWAFISVGLSAINLICRYFCYKMVCNF